MSWVPPRRTTSTPRRITVNETGGLTRLAIEASTAIPGVFKPFEGNGLDTLTDHYYTGQPTDPTSDGASNANTAIDWASRGGYDPVRKRLMCVGTGQGGNGTWSGLPPPANVPSNWRNTHTIFDETLNGNEGGWFAHRGMQPAGIVEDIEMMHQLAQQCIDPVNRRYYRQYYHLDNIAVCDIDTDEWIGSILDPPQDNFSRCPGLEYIPGIGDRGALWAWIRRNSGWQELWQKLIPPTERFLPTAEVAPYTWTQVLPTFAPAVLDGRGLPMSRNPRSNKCLAGGINARAFIFDCANPTTGIITIDTTSMTPHMMGAHWMHMCADPVNDGWLYFANSGLLWRIRADGSFTNIGNLTDMSPWFTPGNIIDFMLFPIQEYGVVWIVGGRYFFKILHSEPYRAWLYKPAVAT